MTASKSAALCRSSRILRQTRCAQFKSSTQRRFIRRFRRRTQISTSIQRRPICVNLRHPRIPSHSGLSCVRFYPVTTKRDPPALGNNSIRLYGNRTNERLTVVSTHNPKMPHLLEGRASSCPRIAHCIPTPMFSPLHSISRTLPRFRGFVGFYLISNQARRRVPLQVTFFQDNHDKACPCSAGMTIVGSGNIAGDFLISPSLPQSRITVTRSCLFTLANCPPL